MTLCVYQDHALPDNLVRRLGMRAEPPESGYRFPKEQSPPICIATSPLRQSRAWSGSANRLLCFEVRQGAVGERKRGI